METNNNFVDGLFFKRPRDGAPDFVKGNLSISKDQFIEWVSKQDTNEKGYINIDLLLSKKNTLYFKVNDYGVKNSVEENSKDIFK